MKKLLPLVSVAGIVLLAGLLWMRIGPRPADELPVWEDADSGATAAPALPMHASDAPSIVPPAAAPPRPRQETLVAPDAPAAVEETAAPALDPRILISPQVPDPTLDPDEVREMRWKLRKQQAGETQPAGADATPAPGSSPRVSLDRKSTSLPTVPDSGKHDRTDVELRVPLGDSWAVRNRVRVDSLESDDPERGQTDVDATTGVELRF